MGNEWTLDEDVLLRKYYPEHGPRWEGWKVLLPARSHKSIGAHAHGLGVRMRDPRSSLVHDSLDGIEDRARVAVAALDEWDRMRLAVLFGAKM